MTWRFLNTGFNTGRFNMEYDEALATQLRNGTGVPTLRVYGWNPPAISIGFNQSIDDFDGTKLQQAGIDIVRRPTGGRAILHAHELTYSVVVRLDDRGPRAIYRFVNEGLLHGLRYLGVNAQLTDANDDFRTPYRDASSIPCFSSSAKSEIQFDGRKLVGSAQRRFGTVVLQHGSILLGPQHRRIVDFLAPHVDCMRHQLDESLSSSAIDVETIIGRPVTFDEIAACIRRGFEEACCVTFDDAVPVEMIDVDRT